jgi:hypothetical protein
MCYTRPRNYITSNEPELITNMKTSKKWLKILKIDLTIFLKQKYLAVSQVNKLGTYLYSRYPPHSTSKNLGIQLFKTIQCHIQIMDVCSQNVVQTSQQVPRETGV